MGEWPSEGEREEEKGRRQEAAATASSQPSPLLSAPIEQQHSPKNSISPPPPLLASVDLATMTLRGEAPSRWTPPLPSRRRNRRQLTFFCKKKKEMLGFFIESDVERCSFFVLLLFLSRKQKIKHGPRAARPGPAVGLRARAPPLLLPSSREARWNVGSVVVGDDGAPQGGPPLQGAVLPCIGIFVGDVPMPRRLRGAPPGLEGERRLLRLRGWER